MENNPKVESNCILIDGDLQGAESIIGQLDEMVQNTGNLKLSQTLNEISDSYESIRELLKVP
jgi:hypothetical protein